MIKFKKKGRFIGVNMYSNEVDAYRLLCRSVPMPFYVVPVLSTTAVPDAKHITADALRAYDYSTLSRGNYD